MKQTVLLFLCLSVFSSILMSQDFIAPTNYSLVAKEDYSPYEKDIIAAAYWLEKQPFNKETDKYKETAKFIIQWISGSPTVNVELNETIIDLDKKNSGMMLLYMAASARYILENNYSKDMRAKHKAALTAMLTAYKEGNGVKKDKKMEKLSKASEENKLDVWLDENLKVGH
jgi:hypothetical protein